MTLAAGLAVREERLRRHWTMRELAERAGVARAVVQAVESGSPATLDTYARIGAALAMRPSIEFEIDAARSRAASRRSDAEDFVHAAMGESEARWLSRPDTVVAIDEPYQHYQFAGRADVLAWQGLDLLHIENRTRFPNIGEAAGSYNAKRRYLASALGERLDIGPRGWRSVTHVIAALWSSEVLHVLRLRPATFAALCPDPPDALGAWLQGSRPAPGVTSSLILVDPAVDIGGRRRTFVSLADLARAEPRYRGYADAAERLRLGRPCRRRP